MAAAQKAFTVGGVGAQPTLDDVVRIAYGQSVVLDAAGADRVKKLSPTPKQFQAEPAPESTTSDAAAPGRPLSSHQVKAVVAAKLLALMNGRSGTRVQVCEFLVSLLNHNVIPVLHAQEEDQAVLRSLANACHASGNAIGNSGTAPVQLLSDVLASKQIAAPGLSAAERAAIESGGSATAGVAALIVQGSKKLLTMAAAVAALSCEALGLPIKAFDADLLEARGFKAAVSVADELRSLMEGSKRVGTTKGADNTAAFASVPQRVGAAAEAAAAAYTAVRSELQSEALAVKSASEAPPVPTLASTLTELARCLLAVAHDSVERSGRVCSGHNVMLSEAQLSVSSQLGSAQTSLAALGAKLLSATSGALPTFQAAMSAAAALDAAERALALEATSSVAVLRIIEGPPAPSAAAAEPAPEVPADSGSADAGAAAGGRGKQDKGGKKKGGAQGVVLGKGTALLRSYVEAAAAGQAGSLALAEWGGALASDLQAAYQVVCGALEVLAGPAAKFLEELKGVVEANQARRKPKIAKGARDFLPEQMAIRERAFAAITGVFKRHGAVGIDTPVFELRETLMGKYGEDSKLIYDLADQGGEILSLRYDLTVPFARYVAVHNVGNIKRYHIGKVYRRDQPQMNRGRFREFFQCDFDIAGSYSVMVADAEVLKVLVEILDELRLGSYEVKLNHRRLLDAMLQIAGVPPQKFRAICSAIDKLDKEPWEAVRAEMVEEKGLPGEVADIIGQFVVLKGKPKEMLALLTAPGHPLGEHPESRAALDELAKLFEHLEAMDALGPISFDLSLARGLDYYTGVIYEAVLQGANVGSIAAGGRYDKLVGMFSGKDVPAVGVSIGIERVFAIMEAHEQERAKAAGKPLRATETEVLVASIGNNMQIKRMQLASQLWSAGIKAEFGYKPNPKMGDQLNYAFEEAIPFMVLFGDDELSKGVVKVKDIDAKTEDVVSTDKLVEDLRARLASKRAAAAAGGGAAASEAAPATPAAESS